MDPLSLISLVIAVAAWVAQSVPDVPVALALFGIDDMLLFGGAAAIGKSLLGYASGKATESERTRRFKEFLAEQDRLKKEELSRGIDLLTKNYGGQIQRVRARAAKQALAGGGVTSAESYSLPAESAVAGMSSKAIRQFVTDTESRYNNMRAGAYADYENRPIETGWEDVGGALLGAGSDLAFGMYGQQQSDNQLKALLSASGGGSSAPIRIPQMPKLTLNPNNTRLSLYPR